MAKHKPQPKQAVQQTNVRQVAQVPDNKALSYFDNPSFERWIPAILALLIFVSYIPVWQNSLVWDDKPYITLNDIVKNFDLKGLFTEYAVGNYHPLTMLSLAIEYALVKEQTWLYHFDNLVLPCVRVILDLQKYSNYLAKANK